MAPDEERWELEDGTDLTDEEIRQVEAQLARDLEAERGQRREAAFRIATGVAGAILFGSILVWTIGTAIYPFVSNAVQGAAVEGQAGWELNLRIASEVAQQFAYGALFVLGGLLLVHVLLSRTGGASLHSVDGAAATDAPPSSTSERTTAPPG